MQFLLERKHQIPDVPTLLELAPADKKDVVEFMSASTPFGRGIVMGPGVPADRVAALRAAFAATIKDPAFLASAQKRQVDIDWRDHQHTMALVKKIVGASPELIARVKKSIEPGRYATSVNGRRTMPRRSRMHAFADHRPPWRCIHAPAAAQTPRRLLQRQDHHHPDGHRPRRQLRPLRPHHRRASRQAHPRPSEASSSSTCRARAAWSPAITSTARVRRTAARSCCRTRCRWSSGMSPKGVQFETAKMHWLGAYDAIAQMMVLWHTVPVRTLDELRTKDFVVGSFNKTHLSYQWAMLTKNILGTNYKVTTGYPSGNHLNLAMEREEIAGWTISWENLYAVKPEWLREKKVTILVQYTVDRLHESAGRADACGDCAAGQAADGGVHRVGHAVCARAGGRSRRAEGAGRCAAQGVRRPDAGPGIPGRREEAQARHQSAQRRGDARAA